MINKYTYKWYLENFIAMNRTPKQKHPVYEKYIDLALLEDQLSDHDKLELIKAIHAAFKESVKHEDNIEQTIPSWLLRVNKQTHGHKPPPTQPRPPKPPAHR